jgi:hypothetical protein
MMPKQAFGVECWEQLLLADLGGLDRANDRLEMRREACNDNVHKYTYLSSRPQSVAPADANTNLVLSQSSWD